MTPIIDTAAKRVAEATQHGCHYAEGTCEDCRNAAIAVLMWALPAQLPNEVIDRLALAVAGVPEDLISGDYDRAIRAYTALPIISELYGYDRP